MTPAVDELVAAGVVHRLLSYDHDPSHPSFALEAAEALGLEPEQIFKTLVAEVSGVGLVVGVVPASAMLDLKALARSAGGKRAEMADPAVAQRSSGYVVGGISPFGQRRRLPTFVDETCGVWDEMLVSAGRRGLEIAVAPADLISVLDAAEGPIAAW